MDKLSNNVVKHFARAALGSGVLRLKCLLVSKAYLPALKCVSL